MLVESTILLFAVGIDHVVRVIIGYGFPKLSADIVDISNTNPPS
jgi:hypothetical protein